MLVITRKVNERIYVANGTIVVTVVKIDGNQVRIGFEAAKSVSIDREEIFWLKEERGQCH